MAAKNETNASGKIISATENAEIFNIVIPVKLVLSNAPQSGIGTPFESAFAKAMADKIGFDWVYIPCGGGAGGLHRALLYKQLRSFWLFGNWVCFA